MQILVIVSFLATLVVNGLANALPINGQTTGEISNRFEVLFTPAGYVFAIWGVIYIGLAALSVYQALPAQRDNPRLQRARPWIAASGLGNIAWLLLWHYERFGVSLAAMIGLLGTLVVAYLALGVGRQEVARSERWLAQIPIGVYLGWVSVATIANVSVVLEVAGWSGAGLSPEVWALVMIGAALAIGVGVVVSRRDPAFPLVLLWAFAGIAVRNASLTSLAVGAWIAAGLAGVLTLVAAAPRTVRPAPQD